MITKEIIFENIRILRNHVIYCVLFFLICIVVNFFFADKFISYFTNPLINLIKNSNAKLIYTNLIEPFAIRMNLAIIGAIFFSLPFFIWQIYIFVSPGLYKKERLLFLPYLIFSPLLFLIGGLFVYYFIFPNAWSFFLKFAYKNDVKIEMMVTISEYLNLCIKMMILFGLAFQLPIIINILLQLKIINVKSLKKARRFVIVGIFIISAILTPPDILSQIALSIPLILLYESSILIGKLSA